MSKTHMAMTYLALPRATLREERKASEPSTTAEIFTLPIRNSLLLCGIDGIGRID